MDIYKEMLKAYDEGRDTALITIVDTTGTTPRRPGTKMLCYDDGSIIGTIGGGAVERQAIKDALECINNKASILKGYTAAAAEIAQSGMTCGADVTVFIESCISRLRLYLFGAGHVAGAIIPLAKSLGFHTTVIDPREPADIKNIIEQAHVFVKINDYSEVGKLDIPPGGHVIIGTHAHHYDGMVLEAALSMQAAYIGMLAGKPKIKALYGRLLDNGVEQSVLNNVYAPIGLDIGGETPSDIAVSVMAEILAVHNGRKGGFYRDIVRAEMVEEER